MNSMRMMILQGTIFGALVKSGKTSLTTRYTVRASVARLQNRSHRSRKTIPGVGPTGIGGFGFVSSPAGATGNLQRVFLIPNSFTALP